MPDAIGPPGCPYDPGNAGIARRIKVQTVTIHRTTGTWPGDYSVGKNRSHNDGTFQYLIGQAHGQWVQFYPLDTFASHAAGANQVGPGIEISGQNGEPLTDWQVDALGRVLRFLRDEWGIAPTFTDGDPRVWADNAPPLGFITHRHVAYPPNVSFQHYDYITDDEFSRALGGGSPAPEPGPERKAAPDVTICCIDYLGVKAYLVQAGLIVKTFHGPLAANNVPQDANDHDGWTHCGIVWIDGGEWTALLRRSGVIT